MGPAELRVSGIWDTLGFMTSEDTEEIWAVARSAQGKVLLWAVKLGITNPSLMISSSLVMCPHSTLHNEPRLQPGVSALSSKVCCCNVLCRLNVFFPLQDLEKGSIWDFWKLNTFGEAKPVQSIPVIMPR